MTDFRAKKTKNLPSQAQLSRTRASVDILRFYSYSPDGFVHIDFSTDGAVVKGCLQG